MLLKWLTYRLFTYHHYRWTYWYSVYKSMWVWGWVWNYYECCLLLRLRCCGAIMNVVCCWDWGVVELLRVLFVVEVVGLLWLLFVVEIEVLWNYYECLLRLRCCRILWVLFVVEIAVLWNYYECCLLRLRFWRRSGKTCVWGRRCSAVSVVGSRPTLSPRRTSSARPWWQPSSKSWWVPVVSGRGKALCVFWQFKI